MEAELRARQAPVLDLDDNSVLRRLLLGRIERIEALEARVEETTHALAIASQVIEQDAPKIEAYETLMSDRGECNLANACRLIGAEQRPFFKWLRDGGYVFDQGDSILPNAEYRKAGQFRVRLVDLGYGRHREQTLATRQGLVWLRRRWQAHLLRKERQAAAARIQGELGV
jgi:phage antirepressor YoqD-like protein